MTYAYFEQFDNLNPSDILIKLYPSVRKLSLISTAVGKVVLAVEYVPFMV